MIKSCLDLLQVWFPFKQKKPAMMVRETDSNGSANGLEIDCNMMLNGWTFDGGHQRKGDGWYQTKWCFF